METYCHSTTNTSSLQSFIAYWRKLIRNIRHGFMKMAIYYMKERGLSYFVIH